MACCAIEEVYSTIQRLKGKADNVPVIPIEAISEELSMNKDLVIEYVTALQILELISNYDPVKEEVVA